MSDEEFKKITSGPFVMKFAVMIVGAVFVAFSAAVYMDVVEIISKFST